MNAPASTLASAGRRQRLIVDTVAYLQLAKPRVVALIVFTAVVGMLLAPAATLMPGVVALATFGIALAAGSAAAFNHVLDRRTDAIMARTRSRPLPTHQLSVRQAVAFAVVLAMLSAATLVLGVNTLTAALTLVRPGRLLGRSTRSFSSRGPRRTSSSAAPPVPRHRSWGGPP